MDLKDILAVSGLPGLYRLKMNRVNGLIIEDLSTGKNRFASVRRHKFTPLESIGVYTNEDTLEIGEVFKRIKTKSSELSIPVEDAPDKEFQSFFEAIVPDYNKTRVRLNDMRKIIGWYRFLEDQKLFEATDEEE